MFKYKIENQFNDISLKQILLGQGIRDKNAQNENHKYKLSNQAVKKAMQV